jgi:histidyl-tRNA synthetase
MVLAKATELAGQYGFLRVDVPIIEYTDLFLRGVGVASDFFVQKEMYTIEEADGTSLSLRPEFTAGLVRAYIENGMASWPQPVKLFTIGPIFRHDRPQAGRYRQHSQFDIEILGESDPAADLEILMLARQLYAELGYRSTLFQVNSTGCPRCKPAYVAALAEYLGPYLDRLSGVDQERMRRNPLRILDSKEPGIDALLAGAPKIMDFLCDDCASHFAELRQLMEAVGLPYEVNFRLVRGIDYYTKTVFEVWDRRIGAQAAIGAGGRYDGLAEAIGGAPTPGVGCGIGIERVILGLKAEEIEPARPPRPAIMVLHFGGPTKTAATQLVYRLRDQGLSARLAFARERRSMKSQMREADRHQARLALIVGESELVEGQVMARSMGDGRQSPISLAGDELEKWVIASLARPD